MVRFPCSRAHAQVHAAVVLSRIIEDYAVIYCGSAVFKISRLLLIAMMCAAPAFYCVSSCNARDRVVLGGGGGGGGRSRMNTKRALRQRVAVQVLSQRTVHSYPSFLVFDEVILRFQLVPLFTIFILFLAFDVQSHNLLIKQNYQLLIQEYLCAKDSPQPITISPIFVSAAKTIV